MNAATIGFALLIAVAPVAAEETLTNESVVTLAKAGIGPEAIVAKIRSTPAAFATTMIDLLSLKRQGVPDVVIAAMIDVGARSASPSDSADPTAPHPSGVYLLAAGQPSAPLIRIDPVASSQTRTGGILGYTLTGGWASLSMKSVLPDASARVAAATARPTFYFYFGGAEQDLGNSGGALLTGNVPVTSPAEFSLVRFAVKGARREAKVGSFNIRGTKAGVMDKDRIAFDYERVGPGIYRVTPRGDLAPGEYGFLYSSRAGGGPGLLAAGGITSRVFDFSISARPDGDQRAAATAR